MIRIVATLALSLATTAVPAAAQDLLGGYFAFIGTADMHNSKGVRLTNFCGILQQDRANVHKFRIRQEYDEGDPWFTTLAARQKIAADCRIGAGSEYIRNAVLRGEERYVRVQVYGWGGVPEFVVVHEGAG
ncbi:hypothetical protein [Tropicimonas sp. IMCC6043]|uniref:hypothetical protein n=1 Tax=Tropicimonas sp. IMCC6043 TaxID=2510645 RepID=UPI00101C0A03|nr:hypothetical protein [Tropicimonas sp. IMCC6043]RYH12373.1 hypothetical protein EU800_02100 [Tropicimonas sp. IMCC6043]